MCVNEGNKLQRSRVYVIPGCPIALARPRLTRSHVWDPQKQLKLIAGITLQSQHEGKPFFVGPLAVDILFCIVPEAAKARKIRKGKFHTFKPDLDNLIKFVLDVANDILYADDSIIAVITATKRWDTEARTEFTITPME